MMWLRRLSGLLSAVRLFSVREKRDVNEKKVERKENRGK